MIGVDAVSCFDVACKQMVATGTCKSDCCGPIPFSAQAWEKHKDDVCVPAGKVTEAFAVGIVLIVSEDGRCPFLNRASFACAIYEDRPWVCRQFGDGSSPPMTCPYLNSDGTRRSRSERRAVSRTHESGWREALERLRKAAYDK